ncbi:hypothetical protein ESZ91_02225 [Candidatus Borkfalkia ceftriaxoniphila]|uniref:Glycoside hydrolase family 42 N-terminal domain-containing protein n=1 Tax=Candidatus Borkfalkia ceftriaxoniphila TaxID=2508949 RepID=A0A4Q2KCJ0_9FIRM|nr:hypothetical protein [Candidatus Borkfalkia ceftriaxoniphila]RXZ61222.1 hypothetical protein ESZ91_02225 [Candidatus Borkfalkia ceftriaxoniphila]
MNEGKLLFVAYLSPPPAKVGNGEFADNPNYIDEKNYRTMIDCGFDRAIGLFENQVPHYIAGMRAAEKVGMDYLVRDQFQDGSIEGIIDDLQRSGKSCERLLREKERAICDRFDEYAKYPAFSGILASDEPPASKFTAIRTVQDWFCGRYPGKEFIVNLLPTYANAEQLSGDEGIENFDYEKDYVNAFIDIVDPQILSYDHYALIYDKKNDENVMRADYLRNLEIFAECSRRTGKPFYNFMLTIGHLFYRTVRAYEDIAWQVYTSLAYGCTGMQTFTYWTLLSNGEAENITSALVLRDGGKTQAWYSMRQVISEVRAFEKEFLKYRWCGAMVAGGPDANFGQLQHTLSAHPAIAGLKADAPCVVGIFEREGTYALLIANFTDPIEKRNVRVSAKMNADGTTVYYRGKRQKSASTISLELESGAGAFVLLEYLSDKENDL